MTLLIHNLVLLFTAFGLGIFGGVHCIGMCGGLVTAFSYSLPRSHDNISAQFSYQFCLSLGRIMSYTMLGAVIGMLGMGLLAGFNAQLILFLRVLSALFVILIGLHIVGFWKGLMYLERLGKHIWRPLSQIIKYVTPIHNHRRAIIMGMIWGYLPCGMVYSALLFSLSAGDWWLGALIMFSFGLGTLPALLLFGTSLSAYQQYVQKPTVRRWFGLLTILLGCFSLGLILQHGIHAMSQLHCK